MRRFSFCNHYYNIVIFLFFDKILLTNDKNNAILKKKPLFSNRGINMQRKNRSLKLSIAFTTFFAIALAFLTVSAPWSVGIICKIFKHEHLTDFLIFMTYLAIPAGWGALVLLYKILFNVRDKKVFIDDNVKYLTMLSWLCFYVGIISIVAAINFVAFVLVSLSALFIGLIVRVVRNIIEEAIELKEDSDLTI